MLRILIRQLSSEIGSWLAGSHVKCLIRVLSDGEDFRNNFTSVS